MLRNRLEKAGPVEPVENIVSAPAFSAVMTVIAENQTQRVGLTGKRRLVNAAGRYRVQKDNPKFGVLQKFIGLLRGLNGSHFVAGRCQ